MHPGKRPESKGGVFLQYIGLNNDLHKVLHKDQYKEQFRKLYQ